MAIATICETDLVKNIMSQIRQDEETIVKQIQNPISVMTINMKSPSLLNAIDEHKKKLLSVILRSYPSAIIFCRELPGNFKDAVVSDGATFGSKAGENETAAAVVWAAGQFKEEKIGDSANILKDTLDTMENDEHVRYRLSMVKLTSNEEPPHSTLAVSYHSLYKEPMHNRSTLTLHLLEFLTKVKKEEKDIQSFIVGGDFNLNTTELNLREFSGLVSKVVKYPLTARAKKKTDSIPHKDNFIWSTEIRVDDIEALECGNKYAAFDHDPVVGKLVFRNQEDRPQNSHAKQKKPTKPVPASSPTR